MSRKGEPNEGPTRSLACKAGAAMLLAGAALVLVTVALPPAAEHSDAVILVLGAIAGIAGVVLLLLRRPGEPVLGLAGVVGTLVITGATFEAGLAGTGPSPAQPASRGTSARWLVRRGDAGVPPGPAPSAGHPRVVQRP